MRTTGSCDFHLLPLDAAAPTRNNACCAPVIPKYTYKWEIHVSYIIGFRELLSVAIF